MTKPFAAALSQHPSAPVATGEVIGQVLEALGDDGRPVPDLALVFVTPVRGARASAARQAGGDRLVIDDRVVNHGAVGAFLGPEVEVTTVVSQGCRPVGHPFVVTRAEENIVYELAGRSAVERLQEVAAALSDEDRELLADMVQIGRVIDESKVDFGPGDFLVRPVVGADPNSGALRVGDVVSVGSTAQFQIRDADSADL